MQGLLGDKRGGLRSEVGGPDTRPGVSTQEKGLGVELRGEGPAKEGVVGGLGSPETQALCAPLCWALGWALPTPPGGRTGLCGIQESRAAGPNRARLKGGWHTHQHSQAHPCAPQSQLPGKGCACRDRWPELEAWAASPAAAPRAEPALGLTGLRWGLARLSCSEEPAAPSATTWGRSACKVLSAQGFRPEAPGGDALPDLSPKPWRTEVSLGLSLLNCSSRQSIFMM